MKFLDFYYEIILKLSLLLFLRCGVIWSGLFGFVGIYFIIVEEVVKFYIIKRLGVDLMVMGC